MIDELLEMIANDFTKVLEKINFQNGVVMNLPNGYDQRFEKIMLKWSAEIEKENSIK